MAPSAPPPAVAMDLAVSDDDIDGFASAAKKARKRTMVFGGVVGGLCVVAVVLGAIALGGDGKEAEKPSAAAQPPPPAVTVATPAPAADPAPAAASASAKSKDEKPEYTPATAAAAYAAQQRRAKGGTGGARAGGARIGSGVKLQKIQSSGIQ